MVIKTTHPQKKPDLHAIVVDCKGHMMGRLASVVAKQALEGQKIVLVRAERILISGSVMRNRIKYTHMYRKRSNTNPLRGPFHYSSPAMILYKAIRGMLPHKTARGAEALKRINIYEGVPAPYDKKTRVVIPTALKVLCLRPHRKYTPLSLLSSKLGWKYGPVVEKLEAKREARGKVYWEQKKLLNKVKAKAISLAGGV